MSGMDAQRLIMKKRGICLCLADIRQWMATVWDVGLKGSVPAITDFMTI